MEDILRLNIYKNEYCAQKERYFVSEAMAAKMGQLHIRAQQEQSKEEEKKKARKFVSSEEMLYLTYLAEFSNYTSLNSKTARQQWQAMKQQDIITILTNLSEKGYEKFQFLQFYLTVRKKSRIIQRLSNKDCPFFKIYKTVQDFKQKQKGQTVCLVQKDENISTILKIRRNYESACAFKIQILCNMDGTVLLSKPCFSLTVRHDST